MSRSTGKSVRRWVTVAVTVALGATTAVAPAGAAPQPHAAASGGHAVHPAAVHPAAVRPATVRPATGPTVADGAAAGFPFTPSQYTPSQCVATFGLTCYGPRELRAGYHIPRSAQGAGQTIVIVDAYGSPTLRSDLAAYSAEFGLPSARLSIRSASGVPVHNPLRSDTELGWAEETSLDVQQAHGMAPRARIVLVLAPNESPQALFSAVRFAVDHRLGTVMSLSWVFPETQFRGSRRAQLQQAHRVLAAAARAGMSVFASSGDAGAGDGGPTPIAAYPASDPFVTSVGGTALFLSDHAAYRHEIVWNDAANCPFGCSYGQLGATGGAPSTVFAAPSYQRGATGFRMRTTSDVAFDASYYTATIVHLGFLGAGKNGFYPFNGTSEGAPSWAAIAAVMNAALGRSLGPLNPLLYRVYRTPWYQRAFHDITVGDNAFHGSGYPAKKGYDLPTGLGSPDVAKLISVLAHFRPPAPPRHTPHH